LAEYRSLSALALAAVVLGLLSGLALLDPMAWGLPALGLLVSLAALRRIRRDEAALAGRGLARAGLALSLLFAVAAPTDWFLYRYLVRREALRFAGYWFQLLGEGQVQKAYLLTVDPKSRLPLDISLPEMCRRASYLCEELEVYRKNRLVRTLAELGPRAAVRFSETELQETTSDRDYVRLVYEVTHRRDARPETFFVALNLERRRMRGAEGWHLGWADWRILKAERPSELKENSNEGTQP
jgi:hypothetical protein